MTEPTPEVDVALRLREMLVDQSRNLYLAACEQNGLPAPDPQMVDIVLVPAMRAAVQATATFYSQHPEMLAIGPQPICGACGEPVEVWFIAPTDEAGNTAKIARPCGHPQQVFSI